MDRAWGLRGRGSGEARAAPPPLSRLPSALLQPPRPPRAHPTALVHQPPQPPPTAANRSTNWILWLVAAVFVAIPSPAYVPYWAAGAVALVMLAAGARLATVAVRLAAQASSSRSGLGRAEIWSLVPVWKVKSLYGRESQV